jgi:hypothetical protein
MRPLTDAELLAVWERGRRLAPARRALLLLAAVYPDTSADDLARLSVGRRDALLLALREATFGPRVEAVIDCPACGCRLEVECHTEDLRAAEPPEPDGGRRVEVGGVPVAFRLPDSLDLIHAAGTGSVEGARRALGARCLEPAGLPEEELTEVALAAVAEAVAVADPQSAVTLDADCPECGSAVSVPWDVLTFFWRELNAWAFRVLREVHTLAAAYGWTEPTILALSAHRRRLYLEMVTE